ncbi:hypothetical protein [Trichothermofontia sp.]
MGYPCGLTGHIWPDRQGNVIWSERSRLSEYLAAAVFWQREQRDPCA